MQLAGGDYYDLTKSGKVFAVTTAAAGLALSISTSTTGFFALWNPAGSGVNVVPIRYELENVSGTGVLTSFGFLALTPAGASIATAAPVPTGTAISTAVNGFLGSSFGKPQAIVLSAFTLTAVGVHFRGIGIQQGTVATATNIYQTPGMWMEFNGTCIMAPSTFLYPTGTAASVNLFYQTFIWAEIPI